MIAQPQTQLEVKRPFTDGILDILIPIVVIAVIGAAIPAIFWGIWHAIAGSIPKFLGFSRFWLDTISGMFYSFIVVFYLEEVVDARYDLSNDGVWHVTIEEFIIEYPWLSLLSLFLIIDFIVSIFLSFAFGLAGCIALAVIIGIGCGIYRLVQIIVFVFAQFLGSFVGVGEEAEEQDND